MFKIIKRACYTIVALSLFPFLFPAYRRAFKMRWNKEIDLALEQGRLDRASLPKFNI